MAQEKAICVSNRCDVFFLIHDVTEMEMVLRSVCDFTKNNTYTVERHI